MIRKISALLALMLCLSTISACSQAENNIDTASGKVDSIVNDTHMPDDTTNTDSNSPSTNIPELEPNDSNSNALCYSANIEYARSENWLEHVYGDIDGTYFYSSDKIGIICDFGHEWTYENGYYTNSDGHTVPTHRLQLAQVLCVPKGSFTCETDASDSTGTWLSENVLKVRKDDAILYYIKTSNDDGIQDYIACFSLDSLYEVQYTDTLLMSANIMQATLHIMNNDDVTIYQYNNDTLIIAPTSGDAWILDDYVSDDGFEIFSEADGKLLITVFEALNSYKILVDPITHEVFDYHVDQSQLDNRWNIDAGYISCTSKQYANRNAKAWYLYNDRIVCVSDTNGNVVIEETQLLHTSEPLGAERELFFEKVTDAITPFKAHSVSQHLEISFNGRPYYTAENTPFYTVATLRNYLSCLFTRESVDYLISRTYQIGEYEYPYLMEDENGLVYFLLDSDNTQTLLNLGFMTYDYVDLGGTPVLVPVYTDTMTLVCEDGYWKCDLTGIEQNSIQLPW